jgi:hypothetical protein
MNHKHGREAVINKTKLKRLWFASANQSRSHSLTTQISKLKDSLSWAAKAITNHRNK